MKSRTKRKLRFYLSLAGIVALTIVVGVFFQYVVFLAWQMHRGLMPVRTEVFTTMAATLFVIVIVDIFLFFHLIMKRKW